MSFVKKNFQDSRKHMLIVIFSLFVAELHVVNSRAVDSAQTLQHEIQSSNELRDVQKRPSFPKTGAVSMETDNRPGHTYPSQDEAASQAEESLNILHDVQTPHPNANNHAKISHLLLHTNHGSDRDPITRYGNWHTSEENDSLPKRRLSPEDIKRIIRTFLTRQSQCLIDDIQYGPDSCVDVYYDYLVSYKQRHPADPGDDLSQWETTVYHLLPSVNQPQ